MDSFLTRSAKKLEQALGVPRPWELTPATSIGYQMATGEGSIGERARKGTAQFIGRYATNIKSPYDYELPAWKDFSPSAVLKDFAPWLKPDAQTEYFGGGVDDLTTKSAEEVLYREMFDLPPRMPIQQSGLTTIGPKQYTLDRGPLAPDATEEGVNYGRVLGNYVVERQPNSSSLKYRDVWDILSPSKPTFVKNLQMPTGDYGGKGLSERLRQLIAPILRPATISGEIPAPSNFSGFPTSHPFVKNPDGSQSNVKLSSWDIDGKTYVIPTMVGGKELKGKAAVKVAMDYGLDKYPSFSDSKSAEQWIDKYHGKIGEDGKLLE